MSRALMTIEKNISICPCTLISYFVYSLCKEKQIMLAYFANNFYAYSSASANERVANAVG